MRMVIVRPDSGVNVRRDGMGFSDHILWLRSIR
jgi:hypothetical protein